MVPQFITFRTQNSYPAARLVFQFTLAGVPYNFLLDTGAELSVLPSCILSRLSPYFVSNTLRTRSVHGSAEQEVEITGPYHLPVKVCGVKFMHPFYTLESGTPCVAGYDLIRAA